MRESVTKLFASRGIIWGSAGSIPAQQYLATAMRNLAVDVSKQQVADARDAITAAVAEARRQVREATGRDSDVADRIDCLFAWRDRDGYHLLRVPYNNPPEFVERSVAIGSPQAESFGRFALSSREHLEFETLPLDAAKMVSHDAVTDVIRAAPVGVGGGVQIACVAEDGARVVPADQIEPIRDTVSAFREFQKDYIVRQAPTGPARDTGITPTG